MGNLTYEASNEKRVFETYEWDSAWLEIAYDTNIKRVLYIGDSISCQSRKIITAKADGKLYFDGFGTSKGIDNPWFEESIKLFTKQQPNRVAIMFNNGLHGWHLEDETDYKLHYEKMLQFLLSHFKDTPLFILLTTHVADEERNARVIKRNKAAAELAEKYNLPVIDLYSLIEKNPGFIRPDGVHLVEEGYNLLAEAILNKLSEAEII